MQIALWCVAGFVLNNGAANVHRIASSGGRGRYPRFFYSDILRRTDFKKHMTSSVITSLSSSSVDDEQRTVSDVYEEGMAILEANNVPDADDSSRYLLCSAANLGYRYSDFRQNMSKLLSKKELATFQAYIAKRLNREPIQYIIGNWDFCGMQFVCEPPVLIPRPETEELVEYIIASKILLESSSSKILDVGAGTGVIGIALLTQIKNATCIGLDVNPTAVSLANMNAAIMLGTTDACRYHCIKKSFLEYTAYHHQTIESDDEKFDIIVSNPPYIPSADILDLEPEVKRYEDHGALDGGVDGLDIIKDLIKHASKLLKPDGPRELWMEVADTHPPVLEKLLNPGQGGHEDNELRIQSNCTLLECITDLYGNPRFIRLKY